MLKKFYNKYFNKPNWYNLRSTKPISRVFGLDRGIPIDRYYIEKFIDKNRDVITGDVLEISEDIYSKKFGHNIKSYNILHVDKSNKKANIIGDLTNIDSLPHNKFDCFICTQTLNFIFDFQKAIKGMHHLLKKDGTVLTTVGGISQISKYDMERWGDFWRFTTLSAYKSFQKEFADNVEVDFYGNVLSSIAFLEGISAKELTIEELEKKDELYQLLIIIKAKKK